MTKKPKIKPKFTTKILTVAHIKVILGLLDGLTNDQIATKLYVQPFTVRAHLRNISERLKVKGRLNIVMKFMELSTQGVLHYAL